MTDFHFTSQAKALDRSLPALTAYQLDPDKPDLATLKALAHVCIGQSLLQMGQKGAADGAIREFTKATEIKPSLSLPYRYLGYELQRTGKAAQAQKAVQKMGMFAD